MATPLADTSQRDDILAARHVLWSALSSVPFHAELGGLASMNHVGTTRECVIHVVGGRCLLFDSLHDVFLCFCAGCLYAQIACPVPIPR